MSDLAVVLTKNPNAAYRVYDGQATVVLPERSEVHVLNPIGTAVWDRIDGRRTLAQILDAVIQEHEVAPDEARRDVLEFITELRRHGMVT